MATIREYRLPAGRMNGMTVTIGRMDFSNHRTAGTASGDPFSMRRAIPASISVMTISDVQMSDVGRDVSQSTKLGGGRFLWVALRTSVSRMNICHPPDCFLPLVEGVGCDRTFFSSRSRSDSSSPAYPPERRRDLIRD